MTDKSKSPIENALSAFFALQAIEEWSFEMRRADVDRIENIIKSREMNKWSRFISQSMIDYTTFIEEEPFSESDMQLLQKQALYSFALALGIPPEVL